MLLLVLLLYLHLVVRNSCIYTTISTKTATIFTEQRILVRLLQRPTAAPSNVDKHTIIRYYSANQMTLAVLGKESLSQLQSTVDKMFAPVPNRGSGRRPSERWRGKVKPYFNNQQLQAYNIVPVQVKV